MLFYVKLNNNTEGPYTDIELKKLVKSGTVTPETSIRIQGTKIWTPATNIENLFTDSNQLRQVEGSAFSTKSPYDFRLSTLFSEFLSFRWLVTPFIVRCLFLIGLLAGFLFLVVSVWGIVLFEEEYGTFFGGAYSVFMAVSLTLLFFAGLRIICESLIVFFRIHERLEDRD